jgi:hypothetical protein
VATPICELPLIQQGLGYAREGPGSGSAVAVKWWKRQEPPPKPSLPKPRLMPQEELVEWVDRMVPSDAR